MTRPVARAGSPVQNVTAARPPATATRRVQIADGVHADASAYTLPTAP